MNGKERIVAALNRQPVDRTPVWFMRQAGRHLPEYRKLAAEHSFWERCQDLDLCTNITMQPIQRYGTLDAAIVFSDILTPLPAFGYEVEYGGGIRIDPFTFDEVDDWTTFSARKHAPWAADALRAPPLNGLIAAALEPACSVICVEPPPRSSAPTVPSWASEIRPERRRR